MVRVRMLTGEVGPSVCRRPGEELTLPNQEARRLVTSGAAELVLPSGDGKVWELPISPTEYRQQFPPNAPNYARAVELSCD